MQTLTESKGELHQPDSTVRLYRIVSDVQRDVVRLRQESIKMMNLNMSLSSFLPAPRHKNGLYLDNALRHGCTDGNINTQTFGRRLHNISVPPAARPPP